MPGEQCPCPWSKARVHKNIFSRTLGQKRSKEIFVSCLSQRRVRGSAILGYHDCAIEFHSRALTTPFCQVAAPKQPCACMQLSASTKRKKDRRHLLLTTHHRKCALVTSSPRPKHHVGVIMTKLVLTRGSSTWAAAKRTRRHRAQSCSNARPVIGISFPNSLPLSRSPSLLALLLA